MIKITDEMLEAARMTVAHGKPEAIGYRVLLKPLEVSQEIEEAMKAEFEHLAKAGFEAKSKQQALREAKGTSFSIVAHVGSWAFNANALGGPNHWAQEGDVVITDKYPGSEVEVPPGSGDMYRLVNDEAILGRMVPQ